MSTEKPKESPLGEAIRKAREGVDPVAAIKAFNEGAFGGNEEHERTKRPCYTPEEIAAAGSALDNPPPYASDLSLWEPWGRDLYFARFALAREIKDWEALHPTVKKSWCLAAHDYHHPNGASTTPVDGRASFERRKQVIAAPDQRAGEVCGMNSQCGHPRHNPATGRHDLP